MFDNEYISLESVAALLNLPVAYLKRLSESGEIPYLLAGNRKRFQESAVRDALRNIEMRTNKPVSKIRKTSCDDTEIPSHNS